MKEEKRKGKGLVIIAIILLLVMCIGYAAITTQLSVNGAGTVTKATWEISFANVKETAGSATPTSAAKIDATDSTKVSYTANLVKPGDFYEFTVDVKNTGTLPAKISNITADSLSADDDKVLNYTVTYADGSAIAVNDELAAGATKTLKFRLEYDTAITATTLNAVTDNISVTLSYKLDFVQKV